MGKSIARLEQRLGVRLFHRTTRSQSLAEHGKPASVDELSKHVGIAYGRSGRVEPWLVYDSSGQVLKPQVDIRLVFDDLQVITDAAVAGEGLTWLPCWLMAKHARASELAIVMFCQSVKATGILKQ